MSTRNSPGQQAHRVRERMRRHRQAHAPQPPDALCVVCGAWFFGPRGLASHEAKLHRIRNMHIGRQG